MTEHAKQPQLCADCETLAHALAESGPPNDPVIKRCTHNAAVAVASKRNGRIVHWYTSGPLSDDQAHKLAAAVIGNKPINFPRHQ
jgi:hypothetical protein